jgi:hypothetical protein
MDENELRNARERRKRNIAIGLALAGMVVFFFVLSMVRLKGHVFDWTS